MLTLHERAPKSGQPAKQLVIILHGWGADGANLIDLADLWAEHLPDAHFVAPNAPTACEANPYGYQWFSLTDRTPDVMLRGLIDASAVVGGLIDEKLAELNLTSKDAALVGFSQGTMTALHVGLRRTDGLTAILGYSGALLATETLADEIQSRPAVCLIHGEADDVVLFENLALAKTALEGNKIEVQTHARPALGHSIDIEGANIGGEFLKACF